MRLHQDLHDGCIGFLALLFPVIRQGHGRLFGGNRKFQLDQRPAALLYDAVHTVIVIGGQVVIGDGGGITAQLIGMQHKIVGNLPADLQRDLVLKIIQRLAALIGQIVVGRMVLGFLPDEIRIFPYSALSKDGRDEIYAFMDELLLEVNSQN